MNKKSFLKISFTFIIFFINKMIFATTIEKKILFSAYLKGINLAKAEGQIKIEPNILEIKEKTPNVCAVKYKFNILGLILICPSAFARLMPFR